MTDYYVPMSDGRCIYIISADLIATVEGTLKAIGAHPNYKLLVATDGPVSSIKATTRTFEPTGSYTTAEKGLPPEITAGEWGELSEGVQELYRRGTKVIDTVEPIDVSGHVPFDSEVDFDPPKNWSPGGIGVAMGPGLATAFPGWLTGFRQRAKDICAEYARDVYDHNGMQAPIEAYVVAFYDPPIWNRQTKRDKATQQFLTTKVSVSVEDAIGGSNLADAKRRWEAEEARVRELVEPYRRVKVCSHCKGLGHLVPGEAS